MNLLMKLLIPTLLLMISPPNCCCLTVSLREDTEASTDVLDGSFWGFFFFSYCLRHSFISFINDELTCTNHYQSMNSLVIDLMMTLLSTVSIIDDRNDITDDSRKLKQN